MAHATRTAIVGGALQSAHKGDWMYLMTDKFTVTPVQQGRFIEVQGPNFGVSLTRVEAVELAEKLRHAVNWEGKD